MQDFTVDNGTVNIAWFQLYYILAYPSKIQDCVIGLYKVTKATFATKKLKRAFLQMVLHC